MKSFTFFSPLRGGVLRCDEKIPFGASLTLAPGLPSSHNKRPICHVKMCVHKSVFYFCPEFCRRDISVAPKGGGEKNFAFTERAGRRYIFAASSSRRDSA